MALEMPVRMNITLPQLSDGDIISLLRHIEAGKIGNRFASRLRQMLASEARRRTSKPPGEPGMEYLAIGSGIELSQALAGIRQLKRHKNKMSGPAKRFITDLDKHIQAMAESVLEVFSDQISGVLEMRSTQLTLLVPSEVCELCGFSEGTLSRMVEAGSFPRPTTIVGNRRYWLESVVADFIRTKKEEHNVISSTYGTANKAQ